MTEEIWKDVLGYEGRYQVSNLGNVRSLERFAVTSNGLQRWPAKNLKPFVDTNGYAYVNLSNGKAAKKIAVHRLVLSAFFGDGGNLQACHNDGVRTNNVLENLRWDSVKGNALDRAKHGTQTRGESARGAKLSEAMAVEILMSRESSLKLAKEYGVASSTIRAIRLGQNWKHIQLGRG